MNSVIVYYMLRSFDQIGSTFLDSATVWLHIKVSLKTSTGALWADNRAGGDPTKVYLHHIFILWQLCKRCLSPSKPRPASICFFQVFLLGLLVNKEAFFFIFYVFIFFFRLLSHQIPFKFVSAGAKFCLTLDKKCVHKLDGPRHVWEELKFIAT